MTLLKNGRVVDGTGKEPYLADILVKGTTILAVGSIPQAKAETVIDCLGIDVITPGIIDINTDSDHYLTLFTNPLQSDFLLQGVTTIIGGHCGASLAPLLSGSLAAIRKWADIDSVNVDWRSVREFLNVFKRLPLGVNFGTFAGHATMRRAILGNRNRELSDNELGILKYALGEALQDGAYGLSTGLSYSHSRETPYGELRELAKIVRAYGGIYTTHLRDEEKNLISSFEETEMLGKDTQVAIMIDHFRPLRGYESEYQEVVNRVSAHTSGHEIYFNISPFDTSLIAIYTLLPQWAQKGGLEGMRKTLGGTRNQERILKTWENLEGDDLIIAQAPHTMFLVGKTLTQFAKGRGMKMQNALLELMKITQLRAVLLYRNVNQNCIDDALMNQYAIPTSNSAAFREEETHMMRLDRGTKTFSRFLEIAEGKGVPFQAAIQKITALPAQILRMNRRGTVKKGNYADLVIWKGKKPDTVLVNGAVAVSLGRPTGIRSGSAVRRDEF